MRDNFPHYAANLLKVRSKEGEITAFRLNRAQRYVHRELERQRLETGRVRALILKARQWGCSTMVGGRFFHKVVYSEGMKAFILAHRRDATDNLFGMVERFLEHLPRKLKSQNGFWIEVAPKVHRANAKELTFSVLDSGYRVGTVSAAGAASVGRGDTFQLFHGSEVAFWENADEAVSGALQTVPDVAGSEIILESTANGIGGVFHRMCLAARDGKSDFKLIFVPWYLCEEYQSYCPPDFDFPQGDGDEGTTSWDEYGGLYDLDDDQLYWAYVKNAALAVSVSADPDVGPCWKFYQEYPATIEEAFQAGGDQQFIPPKYVIAARRNRERYRERLPVIIGVDIARGGDDFTWMLDRNGRAAGQLVNERLSTDNEMEIVGRLAMAIDRVRGLGYRVEAYVDTTGSGGGVVDRSHELGYEMVHKVNFGAKAFDEERYANKRAEMWGEMKAWLMDEGGVSIPDEDTLHGDICAPVWGPSASRYDSNSRVILEPKEKVKARLGRSPDGGDALGLTFADPEAGRSGFEGQGPTPVPEGSYV
jgi:hypothetical protein